MLTKELWKLIEDICPSNLAEEWDNSGPQISFDEQEINRVLVALEITYDVIDEAVLNGANCIVTHHPLFFDGKGWITPYFTVGDYALKLVKNKISVYSAHTNFDNLIGGNNDYFGKTIGVKNIKPPTIEGSIYRTGEIEKTNLTNLAKSVCASLGIDYSFVHLIGNPDAEIDKIGWCTGAGFDYIYDAYKEGINCYITGDVKYHDARDASERSMNVIDIGHFGSEKIFAQNMASLLKERLSDKTIVESINASLIIESTMDCDPFIKNI